MIKALDERLMCFMEENTIDASDLYRYSIQNPDTSKGITSIFEKKDKNDERLVNALLEVFGKEVSKTNTSPEVFPRRDDYLHILYELYMNPVFSTLALNWFSYEESLLQLSNSTIIYHFPAPKEYVLGMTANAGKDRAMNIGEPCAIEGCGMFRITGREVNAKKITTFHFKFKTERAIRVEVKYKTEQMDEYASFDFHSTDLQEGKTELREQIELDYEMGFTVDVTVYEDE